MGSSTDVLVSVSQKWEKKDDYVCTEWILWTSRVRNNRILDGFHGFKLNWMSVLCVTCMNEWTIDSFISLRFYLNRLWAADWQKKINNLIQKDHIKEIQLI